MREASGRYMAFQSGGLHPALDEQSLIGKYR